MRETNHEMSIASEYTYNRKEISMVKKLLDFFENNMIAWWLIHILFVTVMWIGFIFALVVMTPIN